jgi:RNA polymerase sigma factor (sigma-70 family)
MATTIAEAYKQLEDYRDIVRDIVQNNRDIHGLMDAMNQNYIKLTANYSQMAGTPTAKRVSDPVYQAYQQMEHLTKIYQEQIGTMAQRIINLVQRKVNIENALAALTDGERNVLILRCFEHADWEQVAQRLNYSERWCRQLKHHAIRKLAAKLP